MKKLFSVLLAVIMLVSVLASCSSGKDGGAGTTTEKGKTDASGIDLWMTHSYDKLMSNSRTPKNAVNEYTVYMAKYETEGVHIALRSKEDTDSLRIKVLSGDNDHVSYSMFHVQPILKKGRDIYTDPCVSIGQGTRFKLEKDTTMAILIDFTTTADTPAGEYPYEIAIIDKNNDVYAEAKIVVHVWDFEMPVEHKFQTACGNLTVGYYYGEDYYKYDEMHYEMLLQHNLSGYFVPGFYLDDISDKWMSDPRVSSFVLPYGNEEFTRFTAEDYKAMYDRVMSNPEWAKKAIFYPVDEPYELEHFEDLKQEMTYISENFPGIRTICPYYTNLQIDENTDQIDFMSQYINLHCPKLSNWDEDQIYSEEQMEKYDSFDDRMKALQDRGDTLWSYVCNIPDEPYLNVQIHSDGLGSRVLFWQMYQKDIEGFLYWHSVVSWAQDPWSNTDVFGGGWFGDGILIYTGDKLGLDKCYPVPSIRLKIMRDGIDDVELMYMAEELLGREWVDSIVDQASSSLTSVDVTDDEFAALRIALGNAVEKEMKK